MPRLLPPSVVALIAGLSAAAAAWAGGTTVDVDATGSGVWLTTGSSVVEVDPGSGKVLRRVRPRYPAAIELGASDGQIWVSSVTNGFGAGAVTRIPVEPWRKPSSPLVLPTRPVLSLAVGSGTTWALVGPWAKLRIAAIDQASGRIRYVPVGKRVGWLAADASGQTPGLFAVTGAGLLERLGSGGRPLWTALPEGVAAPPVVDGGVVFAATRTAVYRVDAANGAVVARCPLRSAATTLAVGGGYLWALALRGTAGRRYVLQKLEPRRMRVVGGRVLRAPLGGLSYGQEALWIGRATPRPGGGSADVELLRVDPRTLLVRVAARNLDIG